MPDGPYYRGGNSLLPKRRELRFDPITGLVLPTHGVSVFNRPDGLEAFGGAYQVTNVPEELRIIQRGRNPAHFEVVPAQPMSLQAYEEALQKIILVRV